MIVKMTAHSNNNNIHHQVCMRAWESKRELGYINLDLFIVDNSSNTPKQTTSQQHHQQQPLQKIPTTVSSTHTQSPRSTSGDSPSSRRAAAELPQAMTSLRGIVTHPTTAFYLGELAWVNHPSILLEKKKTGLLIPTL